MSEQECFTPQITGDGSFTFFSTEFDESFHSHYGARQESFLKFVQPTLLDRKAHRSQLKILDICYGLGYNTAAALQTIWQINPNCKIEIIALEINTSVPQVAIAHNLFDNWNYEYTDILTEIAVKQEAHRQNLHAQLLIDDARSSIQNVYSSGFRADAIFLDPFSPPQCPQLWTIEFINLVSKCLKTDGLLATYSCAAAVRMAMKVAQLKVGSTAPVGRRTPGTIATLSEAVELSPLSQSEQEHLLTRASIPYRDPKLTDSANIIIQRRQEEQKTSKLEPTSHWRKRWESR
ncbi:MAG: MnmC family methyltransferase [Mastigocoleus sp. MO_167.B18]|uniref:tRNA (5-methylaminomethyl-2-thiouridine)(34)-methyltransferase MnmD n=1 Tax=Mastigocoleus sp. MO_188.B34 TaxID=3036635 RepID=UPI002602738B|nr:MnmC family methyltransferase [Mastigocoleus sp. MO_188.B34]MDJ0695917.1 MnmC family methyltransferase [Mastigocoleus sp. MO_188.B34]MDJ0772617.1 MnmC family methyltransferase [Mastigocoleus sp. MO_167.B18]